MPKVNPKKIIVILGPTASGKTELSLRLAKKYSGFIISADSRQVYKEMDIGTAKHPPSIPSLIRGGSKGGVNKIYWINDIPHFLIDYIKPDKKFTLADWQSLANKLINSKIINTEYHTPFVVGGTGLYISALVDNYQLPKQKIPTIVRTTVRTRLEKKSLEHLLKDLNKQDPDTFEHIDKTNKRKVIRALEYVLENNKSFIGNQKKSKSPYDFLQLGITLPRDELYKRINKRVDQMIEQGLIQEVKILQKKYSSDLPALSGIGYKQIIWYLNGDITKDEAIELIKRDSRRYAKRQLTWFRRDKRIKWISNYQEAQKHIQKFLK